jgi:hypothetical protein
VEQAPFVGQERERHDVAARHVGLAVAVSSGVIETVPPWR